MGETLDCAHFCVRVILVQAKLFGGNVFVIFVSSFPAETGSSDVAMETSMTVVMSIVYKMRQEYKKYDQANLRSRAGGCFLASPLSSGSV